MVRIVVAGRDGRERHRGERWRHRERWITPRRCRSAPPRRHNPRPRLAPAGPCADIIPVTSPSAPPLALPTDLPALRRMTAAQWRAVLDAPAPQALAWLTTAAREGHAGAQALLGQWLLDGRGTTASAPRPRDAFAWFLKAAQQGDAMGMNMAGRCYENAWGVARDLGAAIRWYRRAADKDLDAGLYNLANQLASGEGLPRDDAQALSLYERAAGWATPSRRPRRVAITRKAGHGAATPSGLRALPPGRRGRRLPGPVPPRPPAGRRGRVDEALAWLRRRARHGDAGLPRRGRPAAVGLARSPLPRDRRRDEGTQPRPRRPVWRSADTRPAPPPPPCPSTSTKRSPFASWRCCWPSWRPATSRAPRSNCGSARSACIARCIRWRPACAARLFRHEGRNLHPTEAAQALAEVAREVLQTMAEGIRATRELAGYCGRPHSHRLALFADQPHGAGHGHGHEAAPARPADRTGAGLATPTCCRSCATARSTRR